MLEDLLEPGKPDWLFLSDMIGDVSYLGIHLGNIRIESSCEDGSCTAVKGTITSESEPTEEFEIGETLTVDDFATDDVFEGGSALLGDVSTRTLHGMNLVHVEYLASGDTADFLGSGNFWGGWLEHQVFGAFSGGITEPAEFEIGVSMSLGDATRAPFPDGNATYTGAMVGLDTEEWEALEGHASIIVRNLGSPSVDARFTQIVEVEGGASRDDSSWLGMSLAADGFKTGETGDFIQGTFYGPLHVEVGGTFEKSGIVGAFGARRP